MFKILALVLVIVTVSTVSGFKPTKAPKPAPQPPHVGRPPRSVQCQKQNEEPGCRQEDATCENINREIKNSDQACEEGCYCISGYFRNSQGECVLKKDCRKKRSVSFAENNDFNAAAPGFDEE